MRVWGGLTLTHRWCRKEVSRLWLTPASQKLEGGREVPALIFLLTGARQAGDCSSWGLLLLGTAPAHWQATLPSMDLNSLCWVPSLPCPPQPP